MMPLEIVDIVRSLGVLTEECGCHMGEIRTDRVEFQALLHCTPDAESSASDIFLNTVRPYLKAHGFVCYPSPPQWESDERELHFRAVQITT